MVNDSDENTQSERQNAELASKDYQLNEALSLLKGINILAKKSEPPQG